MKHIGGIKKSLANLKPNLLNKNRLYRKSLNIELSRLSSEETKSSHIAVVIHLYYHDNWPLFREKLRLLSRNFEYDLYITCSLKDSKVSDLVHADFPNAILCPFPNRGRDVLPFVYIAKYLSDKKYIYLLKFHSKKSTHWGGGQEWLEEMLEKLIPGDQKAAASLKQVLENKQTGVVGPESYYYPLTVNFPANGPHISRILRQIFDNEKEVNIAQKHRKQYGFFAGTMFWTRIDAIKPVLDVSSYAKFEPETGQIDATYAHALERMFCVIPEVNNRKIYSIDGDTITQIPYESGSIPEWSTDHDN